MKYTITQARAAVTRTVVEQEATPASITLTLTVQEARLLRALTSYTNGSGNGAVDVFQGLDAALGQLGTVPTTDLNADTAAVRKAVIGSKYCIDMNSQRYNFGGPDQ